MTKLMTQLWIGAFLIVAALVSFQTFAQASVGMNEIRMEDGSGAEEAHH